MANSHLEGLPPAAQKLAREAYAALSSGALPQAERAITLVDDGREHSVELRVGGTSQP